MRKSFIEVRLNCVHCCYHVLVMITMRMMVTMRMITIRRIVTIILKVVK